MRIQKGKIRFSKRDVWNMDNTLSKIILTALEQFKEMDKNSVPPHLYKDVNTDVHNISFDYSEEYCDEQWCWLLERMMDGFKEYPDFYETSQYKDLYWNSMVDKEHFTEEELAAEYIEPYGLCYTMHRKLKDGYTEDDVEQQRILEKEYYKQIEKQKKEGRELFIKYFDRLWD